ADVARIFGVALLPRVTGRGGADEVGKADDGVERAADAAAQPAQHARLDLAVGAGCRRRRDPGPAAQEAEIAGDDARLTLGEQQQVGVAVLAAERNARARRLGKAR